MRVCTWCPSVLQCRDNMRNHSQVQIHMDLTVSVSSHFCNLNLMKMFGKHWLWCSFISFSVLTSTFFHPSLLLPVLSSIVRLDSIQDPVSAGSMTWPPSGSRMSSPNIQITVALPVGWRLNVFTIIVWISEMFRVEFLFFLYFVFFFFISLCCCFSSHYHYMLL